MRKVSRRQFIKFCAKTTVALAIFYAFPFKVTFSKEKKFSIKLKRFNRQNLYKNNLAG
ncbi:MAG: twin-arginine translocation signal domain-containing protein [Candidatus Omnitrophica bacterium]|nr:twin-arginine translocation signal domain-containing protein [Candidatus Omnitrophota bacterium]